MECLGILEILAKQEIRVKKDQQAILALSAFRDQEE